MWSPGTLGETSMSGAKVSATPPVRSPIQSSLAPFGCASLSLPPAWMVCMVQQAKSLLVQLQHPHQGSAPIFHLRKIFTYFPPSSSAYRMLGVKFEV